MPSPRWSIQTPRSASARRRRVSTAPGSTAASNRLRCRSSCPAVCPAAYARPEARIRWQSASYPGRCWSCASRWGTRCRARARIPAFVTSRRPAHSAAHTCGWWVSSSDCSRRNNPERRDRPRAIISTSTTWSPTTPAGVSSATACTAAARNAVTCPRTTSTASSTSTDAPNAAYPGGGAPGAVSPDQRDQPLHPDHARVHQNPILPTHRHTHLKHHNPPSRDPNTCTNTNPPVTDNTRSSSTPIDRCRADPREQCPRSNPAR